MGQGLMGQVEDGSRADGSSVRWVKCKMDQGPMGQV